MQKTLIVLSVLLCIAFAAQRPSFAARGKRAAPAVAPCVAITCGSVGTTCAATPTSPCGVCSTTGEECVITAGSNTTALCNCFSAFTSCVANLGPYCGLTVYGGWAECATLGLSCCGAEPAHIPIVDCHTPTTWCNATSGNCEAVKKSGFCDSDAECGDPTNDVISLNSIAGISGYSCVSGACTYTPEFPPGAPCTANSDCFSGVCTNSLCVGTPLGGNCVTSLDCGANSYCGSASTCVALIAVGASCSSVPVSEESFACAAGSICDGGVCVGFTSVAAGGSCITSDECVVGNICFDGTCTAPAAPLSCHNNSDCNGAKYEGECACNPISGTDQCIPATPADTLSPCIAEANAVDNCIKSQGCDSRLVGINCCNSQLNCLLDCELKAEGVTPQLACGNFPTCTSTTTHSAAVAVQVSFFLAVIAVVLALVF